MLHTITTRAYLPTCPSRTRDENNDGDINVICRIPIYTYIIMILPSAVGTLRNTMEKKNKNNTRVCWGLPTATVGLYVSCNIYVYYILI